MGGGVLEGKERCVGSGEVWGGVWESVRGEWGNVLACEERNGEGVRKCVRCGAPTQFLPHFPTSLTLPHISLTFPNISPYLFHTPTSFPTPPLIPLPTSSLPLPTPQHIFLLPPHLPSPSQSVAKFPCDEVSGAMLPCRKVTGNLCNHYATLPTRDGQRD